MAMIQSNLEQNGMVIWLTGLSGAGKSTIANALEILLNQYGFFTISLDGDLIRSGMNKDLGYTATDRSENIRRVQEMSKILVQKNIIVLCSFITPDQQYRNENRKALGNQYFEVFVDCPVSICESRDVKGLYKKARNLEIDHFTGIDAGFDTPVNPDLILNSHHQTLEECVDTLFKVVRPLVSTQELVM
jgi:adenylylsulfate kinase